MNPDYETIKLHEIDDYTKLGKPKGPAVADANALWRLLNKPSQHIWITFEEGRMWWCTVRDGAVINPTGRDEHSGNFWLVCDHRWSDESLVHKRRLANSMLPGTVSAAAGFRATVAQPKAWETILRIIRDEQDGDAIKAANARASYVAAIDNMVKRLHWKDFELLIDLVFARRMPPEQTIKAVEASGLIFAELVELPRYHYAVIFERSSARHRRSGIISRARAE